jgi:nitrate reductase gamma subunit
MENKTFETIISGIVGFIVLAIIIAGLVFAFINGGDPEEVECLKWQKEATQFEDYYLLDWQKKQCDAHSIDIKAVVK